MTEATGPAADGPTFAGLAESYRRELRLHCQRIVGSVEESEDLVQEALLRAWRGRATLRECSTPRAWLYRIATNVCLDFLRHGGRRPSATPAGERPREPRPPAAATRWEPGLDHRLANLADTQPPPDEQVVSRETMELVIMVAIRHLPPHQRAVLVLRDVFDWPASDTATLLDISVAAVNSRLRRARDTIRRRLTAGRAQWPARPARTSADKALIHSYMDAIDRLDHTVFGALNARTDDG